MTSPSFISHFSSSSCSAFWTCTSLLKAVNIRQWRHEQYKLMWSTMDSWSRPTSGKRFLAEVPREDVDLPVCSVSVQLSAFTEVKLVFNIWNSEMLHSCRLKTQSCRMVRFTPKTMSHRNGSYKRLCTHTTGCGVQLIIPSTSKSLYGHWLNRIKTQEQSDPPTRQWIQNSRYKCPWLLSINIK